MWEIPGSFESNQKKTLVKCAIFNKYRDLEIFLKFSGLLNTFSLHYFYLSLRLPKLLFSEAIIIICQCIFSRFCRRPYQVAQKLQTCRLIEKKGTMHFLLPLPNFSYSSHTPSYSSRLCVRKTEWKTEACSLYRGCIKFELYGHRRKILCWTMVNNGKL